MMQYESLCLRWGEGRWLLQYNSKEKGLIRTREENGSVRTRELGGDRVGESGSRIVGNMVRIKEVSGIVVRFVLVVYFWLLL